MIAKQIFEGSKFRQGRNKTARLVHRRLKGLTVSVKLTFRRLAPARQVRKGYQFAFAPGDAVDTGLRNGRAMGRIFVDPDFENQIQINEITQEVLRIEGPPPGSDPRLHQRRATMPSG